VHADDAVRTELLVSSFHELTLGVVGVAGELYPREGKNLGKRFTRTDPAKLNVKNAALYLLPFFVRAL